MLDRCLHKLKTSCSVSSWHLSWQLTSKKFHHKQNIDQEYPAKLSKGAFCMPVVNKSIQSCEIDACTYYRHLAVYRLGNFHRNLLQKSSIASKILIKNSQLSFQKVHSVCLY